MAVQTQNSAVSLGQLLPEMGLPESASIIGVNNLVLDHRQANTGSAFIAVPGHRIDGREFCNAAIEAGVAAVLKQGDSFACEIQQGVTVITVPNLKHNISAIAGRFYGEPSAAMCVLGVTGTNGKTTCTQLLAQMAELNQQRAAVMGTMGYGRLSNGLQETGATTSDPISTQRQLAEFASHQVDVVAMEVSSHGLDQGRVAAVQFSGAVFTNLTHDHLDYHGTMDQYGAAKRKLFTTPSLKFRVINIDDEFGKTLCDITSPSVPSIRYSCRDASADVYVESIQLSAEGMRAKIKTPWGCGELNTQLVGEFNLANVLAVVCACCARGESLDSVLQRVPLLKPVHGRMEKVSAVKGPSVYVDYAHTPDSLLKALQAIKAHTEKRLFCVFGCGGDRDREKRPLMAAAAEQLADVIVVTQDNPRHESSEQIMADIDKGFSAHAKKERQLIVDRADAIQAAIAQAEEGDTVLIAGKGHETYQQIADQVFPFDDVQQARLALSRWQGGQQ